MKSDLLWPLRLNQGFIEGTSDQVGRRQYDERSSDVMRESHVEPAIAQIRNLESGDLAPRARDAVDLT